MQFNHCNNTVYIAVCPPGWILGDQSGKCLTLTEPSSWVNAQNICDNMNGSLIDMGNDKLPWEDKATALNNLTQTVTDALWVNAPGKGPLYEFNDGKLLRYSMFHIFGTRFEHSVTL